MSSVCGRHQRSHLEVCAESLSGSQKQYPEGHCTILSDPTQESNIIKSTQTTNGGPCRDCRSRNGRYVLNYENSQSTGGFPRKWFTDKSYEVMLSPNDDY